MTKQRPAVSLVELLASIAVMGIIVLIVINLYISSGQFVGAEQLRIDVGLNASRALATVDETLREGRAVLASTNYGGDTYTTSDTTLVLTTPSLLVSGSLSSSEVDTIILDLDSSNPDDQVIRRIVAAVGAGSTRTTGVTGAMTGVQDLYFRYTTDVPTDTTVVTATITTVKTVNTKPFTTAIILNATLRNHP